MAGGARVTQGVRFGDRQGGRGEQMWQSYPGRSSGQTEAGFFFFNFYLSVLGLKLQHVGSSSLTKDQTQAPCSGSMES